METAEFYLQNAEKCECLARECEDAGSRAYLIDAGAHWRRIAQMARGWRKCALPRPRKALLIDLGSSAVNSQGK